ncbi:MAG: hypothetical protein ACREVP_12405 [Burkholderiales bacterium]
MRARIVIVALASIAALGLAGCGDQPQELAQKDRSYQGKPDSNPWDTDSSTVLHTTSKWTKGDRASWDAAISTRALNQNEYVRVR